jgi:hypothetical protein
MKMKTKNPAYKIETVSHFGDVVEATVFIVYDSVEEEFIVFNSPQPPQDLSLHQTLVYTGPYSAWEPTNPNKEE